MRWWWIDKFHGIPEWEVRQNGEVRHACGRATGGTIGPSYPVMPPSLIIEGLAQTGGLLVGQLSDFERSVVLAKVSKAKFHFAAKPGDKMVYTANLDRIEPDGALVCCTVDVADRRLADIELYFAYFDNRGYRTRSVHSGRLSSYDASVQTLRSGLWMPTESHWRFLAAAASGRKAIFEIAADHS